MAKELDPITSLPTKEKKSTELKLPKKAKSLRTPTIESSGTFEVDNVGSYKEYLNADTKQGALPTNLLDLQKARAQAQGAGEQTWIAAKNIVPNIALGIVENIGYLGALATEWGDDTDYKNGLTEFAQANRNPLGGEIYRENPNEVWDTSDPAWWIQNAEGLVESIGEFAVTGFGVGAGLKAGASAIARAVAKGSQTALKVASGAAQVGTAATLAYTEGAMSGALVYDKVYNAKMKEHGNENKAKHQAAQAASTTVHLNTTINTLFNIGSVGALFKSNDSIRKLMKAGFKRAPGEADDVFLARMKKLSADVPAVREALDIKSGMGHYLQNTVLKEGTAEGMEELTNLFAEKAGERVGLEDEDSSFIGQFAQLEHYFEDTMNEEGALNFVLGMFGGIGQNTIMDHAPMQRVVKTTKDKDGNEKAVVDENNNTQYTYTSAHAKDIEAKNNMFNSLAGGLISDIEKIQKMHKDLGEAVEKGDTIKADQIRRNLSDIQEYQSVRMGMGENLVQSFENIAALDNIKDLGEAMQPDIDALKDTLEGAETAEEQQEIQAELEKALAQQKTLFGKTEAMHKGFAESINDNKYKDIAADKVESIKRSVKEHERLRALYTGEAEDVGVADEAFSIYLHRESLKSNLDSYQSQLETLEDQLAKDNERLFGSEEGYDINNIIALQDEVSGIEDAFFEQQKELDLIEEYLAAKKEGKTKHSREIKELLKEYKTRKVKDLSKAVEKKSSRLWKAKEKAEDKLEKLRKDHTGDESTLNEALNQTSNDRENIKQMHKELAKGRVNLQVVDDSYTKIQSKEGTAEAVSTIKEELSKIVNKSKKAKKKAGKAEAKKKSEKSKEKEKEKPSGKKKPESKEKSKEASDTETKEDVLNEIVDIINNESKEDDSVDYAPEESEESSEDRKFRLMKKLWTMLEADEAIDQKDWTSVATWMNDSIGDSFKSDTDLYIKLNGLWQFMSGVQDARSYEEVFKTDFEEDAETTDSVSAEALLNSAYSRNTTDSRSTMHDIYKDILNKEDKDNKTETSNLKPVVVNDVLVDGAISVAYGSGRYWERNYVVDPATGLKIYSTRTLGNEKASDFFQAIDSGKEFLPDTEVRISLDKSFKVEADEELITYDSLVKEGGAMKAPMKIEALYNNEWVTLGYIHDYDWIAKEDSGTPINVVKTVDGVDNFKAQKDSIKAIRNELYTQLQENDYVSSKITEKTPGRLSFNLDEKNQPEHLPLSQGMPDTGLKFGISRQGEVQSSKGITHEGLRNVNPIEDGTLVAILPTPAGDELAVPVWINALTEAQSNTLVDSIIAFHTDNKELTDDITNKIGYQFAKSRSASMFEFASRMVFTSSFTKDQVDASDAKNTNMYFHVSEETGHVSIAKQGDIIYTTNPKLIKKKGYSSLVENIDQVKNLAKQLRFNVDFNINKEGSINEILIVDGKVNAIPHASYNEYVKNYTSSSINGRNFITHPDGSKEYTYFDNPIIQFEPSSKTEPEDSKKDNIERNRKAALGSMQGISWTRKNKSGETWSVPKPIDGFRFKDTDTEQELIDQINAKYDAELNALNSSTVEPKEKPETPPKPKKPKRKPRGDGESGKDIKVDFSIDDNTDFSIDADSHSKRYVKTTADRYFGNEQAALTYMEEHPEMEFKPMVEDDSKPVGFQYIVKIVTARKPVGLINLGGLKPDYALEERDTLIDALGKYTVPGFSPEQQYEAVQSMLYQVLTNYTEGTGIENSFNKSYNSFLNLLDKAEAVESDKAEHIDNLLTHWDHLATIVHLNLQNLGFKIEGTSFEGEDSSYEKIRFDESARWEVDSKNTASTQFKQFLSFIPDVEFDADGDLVSKKTFLGTDKFIPFDTVYDQLMSELAENEPTLDVYMDILRSRGATKPVFKKLHDIFTGIDPDVTIDEKTKSEFVVAMSKHYIDQVMLLYSPQYDDKTGKVNGYTFTPINSNRNTVVDSIVGRWVENQKNSNLVKQEKGELVIDREVVKEIKQEYLEILEYYKGKYTSDDFYWALSGVFETMGMAVPIEAIRKISANSKKNLGSAWEHALKYDPKATGSKNFMTYVFNAFDRTDKQSEEDKEKYGAFGLNNPLFGGAAESSIKKIARVSSEFMPRAFSDSFRNVEGKTIYNYQLGTHLSHKVRQFKEGSVELDSILATTFGSNSKWAKRLKEDPNARNVLQVQYLDGLKLSRSSKDGIKRGGMDYDTQLLMAVNLFTGSYKQNKETAKFLDSTKSDKSTTPIITFYKEKVKVVINDGSVTDISEDTMSSLMDIVDSEYNRIIHFQSTIKDKMAKDNIDFGKYSQGADKFFKLPYLNKKDLEARLSKEDFETIWIDGELQNTGAAKALIASIVKEETLAEIKRTRDNLYSSDAVVVEKGSIKHTLIDTAYLKGGTGYSNISDKIAYTAADFVINNMIADSEILTLVSGDPALHWKGGSVKKTLDAVFKRLAKDIAPRQDLHWRGSKKFNKITLIDRLVTSLQIEDYKNRLTSSRPYEDMETTDAQEITTLQEHIDVMYAWGKIDEEVYNSITSKINKAKKDKQNKANYFELTESELAVVLQPQKPVYVGNKFYKEYDVNNIVYTKSSSFPLLPQLTRGMQLDNLRLAMENQNVQRAAYISGDKLGAIRPVNIYGADNNIISDIDFGGQVEQGGSIQELDRLGFGIQQEIPNKSKTEIVTITQMNKLLFEGIRDIEGFNHNGETLTGRELELKKEALRTRLFEMGYTGLLKELGIKDTNGRLEITSPVKIQKILKKEAESRNWDLTEIEKLELNAEGTDFAMPLAFSGIADKVEGLILSVIGARTAKQKMPGKSWVQGTAAGMQSLHNWSDLRAEDKEFINNNIVTLDTYDSKLGLQGMRVEKGEVKAAQVLVPFYFMNGKEKLKVEDYTITKNGKTFIDTDKLPLEVLRMISARIPNQGHNSMLPIEIVGFLPPSMGDLMIVPDNITAQMGSDFDVDKLYTYIYNYDVAEDGAITKLTEGSESDIIKNEIIDIHWSVLTNIGVFDKIINPLDKKDVNDEKELILAALGESNLVKTPIYASTKIFNNIVGAVGQTLVGSSSLASTFNSLLQKHNIKLEAFNKEKNIREAWSIDLHTDDGKLLKLNSLSGNGVSTYKGQTRSKHDNLTSQQNEAVDNINNQTLGYLNMNQITAPVSYIMSTLETSSGEAVSLEYNFRLLRQESIEDLVKTIQKNTIAIGNNEFKSSSAIKSEAFVEIREALLEKVKAIDESLINKDTFDVDVELSPAKLLSLLEQRGKDDKTVDYYAGQIAALDLYQQFDNLAESLKNIRKSILFSESNGSGKNYFQTAEIRANIKDLKFNQLLTGTDALAGSFDKDGNLIPESENGHSSHYAIIKGSEILSLLIPYDTDPINTIWAKYQEILETDAITEKTRKKIWNAFKSYSFTNESMAWGDSISERKRLLIDSENNDSLGKRVKQSENESWFVNNYFFSRLQPVIATKDGIPSRVEYIASKGNRLDVIENVRAIAAALLSDNETERSLMEDLIKMNYLTGGIQGATNFIKFIPGPYLEFLPVSKALHSLDKRLKNNDGVLLYSIPTFLEQYFQHNPQELPQINTSNFASKKVPANFNLTNPNIKEGNPAGNLARTVGGKEVYPEYFSFRDGNTWKMYKNTGKTDSGDYSYVQIDTLGSANKDGMHVNEYANGISATSLIKQNQSPNKPPAQITQTIIPTPVNGPTTINPNGLSKFELEYGTTFDSILNNISIKSTKDSYKIIANVLKPIDFGDDFTFKIDNEMTSAGVYNSKFNSLKINLLDKHGKPKEAVKNEETFLHESIHGITSAKYNTYNNIKKGDITESDSGLSKKELKALKQLDALMAKSKRELVNTKELEAEFNSFVARFKKYREDRAKGDKSARLDATREELDLFYPLINTKEFITAALTNKEFQSKIAKVKFDGDISLLQRFANILTDLLNAISTELGIEVTTDTVLAQAIYSSLDLGIRPNTDEMSYYGKPISLVIENGIAVELANPYMYKDLSGPKKADKVQKVLDAYNNYTGPSNQIKIASKDGKGESGTPVGATEVKSISPDYGVVQVETNPTQEQTKQFVNLIKPQAESQTFKENKGRNANMMFHYGLRWGRVKGNPSMGIGPMKAPIKNNPADGGAYYGYDLYDQNGNSLPPISSLQPILNEIQKSLGIDMSDYDSVIGNIYLPGEYVYPHRDTTESKSAEGYPVVVYTIGNDAGLGIWDDNKGKMTFANTYDSTYAPGTLANNNPTNEVLTKNGTIYTFGMDGKGRFNLVHTTPDVTEKPNAYPPIKLPNGKTVTNYTITLTFRRANNLEAGMPTTPAKINNKPTGSKRKTYSGLVTELKPKQIFVFGSNPEGRHGKGAAKVAKDKFGAILGQGRGLQGQTYGLVTKNLNAGYFETGIGLGEEVFEFVYEKTGAKSVSPGQINYNIKELYETAIENPDKEFLVNDYSGKNLNGYTAQEMAEMFREAGPIPNNIVFNENFDVLVSNDPVLEVNDDKYVVFEKDGVKYYANEGQRAAIDKISEFWNKPVQSNPLDNSYFLSGEGGTGKTTVIGAVIRNIEQAGLKQDEFNSIFGSQKASGNFKGELLYVAPTHNAVRELNKNLPKGSGPFAPDIKAKTLSSLLGTDAKPGATGAIKFVPISEAKIKAEIDKMNAGARFYSVPDIYLTKYLVIDEASMIGGDGKSPNNDSWELLLSRIKHRESLGMGTPEKIIFLGDYAQIPPVGVDNDSDGQVVSNLSKRPDQFHKLTENMRTSKMDLIELLHKYRDNIDAANAGIEKGKASNDVIHTNPNAFSSRESSRNVRYVASENDFIAKFIETYKEDHFNISNTVIVNYNNENHKSTKELLGKVRASLFGDNAQNRYNPGELLILSNQLILKGSNGEAIEFNKDQRFIVKSVEERQESRTFSRKINKKNISFKVETPIHSLLVVADDPDVTYEINILPEDYKNKITKTFDRPAGGFIVDGKVLPYGIYMDMQQVYGNMSYGYVVNSHKVQGSTYDHVFVDEKNILNAGYQTNKAKNQLLYTALSRAREDVHILHSQNSQAAAFDEDSAVDFALEDESTLSNETIARIQQIDQSISSLNKSRTKDMNEKKKQFIDAEIETLKEEKQFLKTEDTRASIENIAQRQLDWVSSIITKENVMDSEIEHAFNILNSWDWEVLKNLLTEDQIEAEVGYFQTFSNIDSQSKGLKKRLMTTAMKVIKNYAERNSSVEININEDFKKVLGGEALASKFLDISMIDNKLVQYIAETIQNSARNNEGLLAATSKDIREKFDGIDQERLLQRDKDGNITGAIITKYSHKYYAQSQMLKSKLNYTIKQIEKDHLPLKEENKKKSNAYKKYYAEKRKIDFTIDIRFLYRKDFGTDNFTNKDEYLAYLENELGKEEAEYQLAKAEAKYDKYLEELESYKSYIQDQIDVEDYTGKLQDETVEEFKIRMIGKWESANSPLRYIDEKMGASLTGEGTGGRYLASAGARHSVSVPRRTLHGEDTGYYDAQYSDLNTAEMEAWEYYMNLMTRMKSYLPTNVVSETHSGFMPIIQKDLIERFSSDGTTAALNQMGDRMIDSLTDSEVAKLNPDQEHDYLERDPETGKPVKRIKTRFLKDNVAIEDRSFDIPKLLEMFSGMAINYKYKSEIEDRVNIANRILADADEIYTKKGRLVQDRFGKTINIKNGSVHVKESVQYAIDAMLYGEKKIDEGVSPIKIYSTNPRTQLNKRKLAKEIENERDKLDWALDDGDITQDDYDAQIKVLSEKYEELGGKNLVWSKVGDGLIKFTQLKGMGYNITAGIANVGFGVLSNIVHANGRADFGNKELVKSFGIMLKSSSSTNMKVANLVKRFNILFEISEIEYGEGESPELRHKMLKNLSPYMIQRRTEFFAQGQSLVAKMLATPITDLDGNTKTLFDAFDSEGEWKTNEFGKAGEWSYILGADETNKFTKFRNKIIQINKINHGNYDPNSPIMVKRSILGRLFSQYRTWMFTGFSQRFKDEYYDRQLDRQVKGRYRTMYDLGVIESLKTLSLQLIGSDNAFDKNNRKGQLDEVDIENMRKNLAEIGVAVALYSLGAILKASVIDDDDDNDGMGEWAAKVLVNQLHRVESDIYFYFNPNTFINIIKNPIAAMKTYTDFANATTATFEYIFDEEYTKRDSPLEKWGKALPIVRQIQKTKEMGEKIFNK